MEIKTKRLILRPMIEDDVNDIYEYSKNLENSKYMYTRRTDDINKIKEYINRCINEDLNGNKEIHSLSITYNKKVIGEVALLFFEEGIELFWIISDKYQNQGFGYEASLAYINYIKDNFNLNKLNAHCDIRNIPSKRIMEKLGFDYKGINKREYPDDREDSMEYSYELIIRK